jgi:hypothetical protein
MSCYLLLGTSAEPALWQLQKLDVCAGFAMEMRARESWDF